MYTVLVVDDEELICQGIKSMIERLNHPGISRVLLAPTAAEARAMILSSAPDIVISDIQMPGENGLSLIKSLMAQPCRMKFVILSGYDEFEYAREALKLGVLDYLLKPASLQELKNVLDNAVSALELEERSASEVREKAYRQLLLENSLRKLFLHKSVDDFDVRNILERLGPFFPYEEYSIGITGANSAAGQKEGRSVEPGGDETGGARLFAGDGWHTVGLRNENDDDVVIVNHRSTLTAGEIISIFKSSIPSGNVATGISEKSAGIASLMMLYRQAEKALSYRLLLCNSAVIEFAAIKGRALNEAFVEAGLVEFGEVLKTLNEKKLSDCIDRLFSLEYLAAHSIEGSARLFHGVSRQLGSLAAAGWSDIGNDQARPFESFATLQDIRIHLKETAYRVIKAQKDEEAERTVMAGTVNYVRENLGKDISLAVAANRASVSYTHFSRLFKKQIGMNFSEYLMKVRMEEAKKLLCNPSLKIYEIASKVGYSDPKHFTRAFRLYYGASPIECRAASSTRL